nr:MAG: GTPase Era [Candidatus Thorarchaeota archaeon SMTZ1-83]
MKAGYCAIVGTPNVGKSTLQNSLVGHKLSIVTPKPQTTRHRVSGILTTSEYQIVFLDSPGIIDPGYELQSVMMRRVEEIVNDADLILLMVEATSDPEEREKRIIERLRAHHAPLFLLINKIDLIKKSALLPLIQEYQQFHKFDEVIPISALKGDGLGILVDLVVQRLPSGEPLYPPDQLSDHPERFFAAEIVRETIFLRYGEEIPYSTAVVVDEFVERPGQKDYIKATIFVERDSQKAVLIGKRGSALKRVGEEARREIEKFLGRDVFLQLWVKTRKNWRKRRIDIKRFGY